MKKTKYCLETAIKETIFPLSWQPPKMCERNVRQINNNMCISVAVCASW